MNRPSLPVTSREVSWGPVESAVAVLDDPESGFTPVRSTAGRRYRIAGSPPRARGSRFHREAPLEPNRSTTPIADEAEIWLAEVSGSTQPEPADVDAAADARDLESETVTAQPLAAASAVPPLAVATPAPPLAPEAAVPPKEKGLLHYLGTAISAALLLLVLAIATLVIVIPTVVGGQALTVLTQSMEPGLPPGTLIVIKPTPAADIRIGDVITFQIASDQPAVVSHRVVTKSIGTDGLTTFTTKGDNNDLVDANPVMEVQVRGTLWYSIPYLGWVNNAVNGDARTFIVPIAAGGLFLYALYMFGGSVREKIRKRRVAATA